MKKILAYGGLILLFLLLQCSFFVHLSLADVVPNLLIILTASIAIINGSLERHCGGNGHSGNSDPAAE